jgi:hypothetical protein
MANLIVLSFYSIYHLLSFDTIIENWRLSFETSISSALLAWLTMCPGHQIAAHMHHRVEFRINFSLLDYSKNVTGQAAVSLSGVIDERFNYPRKRKHGNKNCITLSHSHLVCIGLANP